MAELELGHGRYREHGECQYRLRLDCRHAPAWSALYLRSADAPLDTNGYLNFTFWVHGGTTGGQTIQVVAVINDTPQPGVRVASPTAGSWQKITVPLTALGVENRTDVTGFWVQQGSGVDEPTFYVDTVVLESGVPPTPPPPVNGMAIYQESLVNGWNNWSWASVNTGEHDDRTHRFQCDRRDGRCLRGAVPATRRAAHRARTRA